MISACNGEAPSGMELDTKNQSETNIKLASASCAASTEKFEPSPLDIIAKPVALGSQDDVTRALPDGVSFLGGWHLTAANSDFGGLSGLALQDSGNLLAISDRGTFIEIGLSSGEPNGRGTIMEMRDAQGKLISGKADGDAEGLALEGGLTFVSFEHNHRILAFNLERCGVAAKGILFASLPNRILKAKISANDGAESLNVNSEGYLQAGYETSVGDFAPVLTFDHHGLIKTEPEQIPVATDFKLVGSDGEAHLTRFYTPEQGNMTDIILPETTIRLAPPLTVDNFEGIATREKANGSKVVYIISDDNFSGRQQTLLYKFEVAP